MRVAVRTLPVVGGVVLVLAAWPWAREGMRRHPYFAVREIAAPSHGRIPPDVLRATAGILPGDSIWDVDEAAAAARLRALPWVRTARVRRHFPSRVQLDVREFRPVAILRVDDADRQRSYYVARSGRPFAPVGPRDPQDLPHITGLSSDQVDGGAYGARAVRTALSVVRKANHRLSILGDISEVHVDRERGLTLMPANAEVPIELGWDGIDTKLDRLRYVLAQWLGREREMVAVSCLYDDSVVVRVANVAAPAPTPAVSTPTPVKKIPVPTAKKPRRPTGA